MTDLVITAGTLRHLMMCERRIWLDHHEQPALRDELPQDHFLGGKIHEQNVSVAMFGSASPVPTASWDDMVHATQELVASGVAAIRGAAFECVIQLSRPMLVRGRVDWLRRVSQPSRLGAWTYEPVEIKLRRECTEADRLQLDLYIWLLQQVQGTEPSGWFWMGRDSDNQPQEIIEHHYDPDRLFTALERVDRLLNEPAAPAIFLASHCNTCHWHTACKQEASAGRDLAALPGLPRQTWEHMRREGILTLDQLLTLRPQDLQRFKGLGKSKAREIYVYAQAVVHGRPVQRAAVPEAVRQPGIMLDLETCMDGSSIGVPWCFGWQVHDGNFQVAIVDRFYEGDCLDLPDGIRVSIVSDSDEGWRMFAQAAQEAPGLIYHWGSFEKGVLRSTAPPDVVDALDSRLHDLNRTFKQTFAFPVKGTSIKTVAPYLGFRWPAGTSAFSAWADYRSWLLEGHDAALARACAYNRADVEAMALVWRWMLENDKDFGSSDWNGIGWIVG